MVQEYQTSARRAVIALHWAVIRGGRIEPRADGALDLDAERARRAPPSPIGPHDDGAA